MSIFAAIAAIGALTYDGATLMLDNSVTVDAAPPTDAQRRWDFRHASRRSLSSTEAPTATPAPSRADSGSKKSNNKHALFVPDLFIRKKHRSNQNGNAKFVFLHALGVIYMFLSLMIVCDNFFGPALDRMVEVWDIDDDVAGATFMAAGGSAPELATSFLGQFVSQSDIGFGTIVGSAVFNVLFVIACCALVVPGGSLPLTWWPLFRDCSCYITGLLVLAMFVYVKSNMEFHEALVLFAGYIGYVTVMRYNKELEVFVASRLNLGGTKVSPSGNPIGVGPTAQIDCGNKPAAPPGKAAIDDASGGDDSSLDAKPANGGAKVVPEVVTPSSAAGSTVDDGSATAPQAPNFDAATARPQQQQQQQQQASTAPPASGGSSSNVDDDDEEDYENPWEWPESRGDQAMFLITIPIKVCLYGTLPDCTKKNKANLFILTFGGSLVWLAVFAYFMVTWTTIVGAVIGVCDYIMGLTILAAGTSIPDALSSMYMAREGRGDMAISSSIGSNVFDILVGLPIPVIFKYVVVYITGKGDGAWSFDTGGIFTDTVTLLGMVALTVCSIMTCNWHLNRKLGRAMFVLYFLFLALSIGLNYNSCVG